jgi:predicted nucleotidyltransferase
MVRFHNATYKGTNSYISVFGTPDDCPHGLYLRVFEGESQSYKYYKTSRFTAKQKKEIVTRYVLRERRQYERGLTGSTPNDLWFPRDLVREISLKYLTDKKIGFKSRR